MATSKPRRRRFDRETLLQRGTLVGVLALCTVTLTAVFVGIVGLASGQTTALVARLPVVIAGGSKGTDRETLAMVRGAMDAGADGVSMGRSIFQHDDPEAITRGVAAVVHDDADAETAADRAGLAVEA